MKIHNLSNIQLFEFQSDLDLAQNVLNDILNTDFSYSPNNIPINSYSKTGYKKISKNEVTFYYHKQLYNWVQDCFNEVSRLYFHNDVNLEICDNWVVKTEFGQISSTHKHVASIFSGLYYCTDHTGSNTIFHLNDPIHDYLSPIFGHDLVKKQNMTFKSEPKMGKLIIWPSYIQHSVEMHKEKNVRYTISFNSFLNGQIGTWKSRFLQSQVTKIDEQPILKFPLND